MSPHPKQLELFERIDLIGLNGNTGIHYDKPSCFLMEPSFEEAIGLGCTACPFMEECIPNE